MSYSCTIGRVRIIGLSVLVGWSELVSVTGKTSADDRQKAVDTFQTVG